MERGTVTDMAGLVLTLTAGERVLINGTLLENGDRRSCLRVMTPDSSVLRLRDVIAAEQADTPLALLCLCLQQVLMGHACLCDVQAEAQRALHRLSRVAAEAPEPAVAAQTYVRAQDHLRAGDVQRAHAVLRTALRRQERSNERSALT